MTDLYKERGREGREGGRKEGNRESERERVCVCDFFYFIFPLFASGRNLAAVIITVRVHVYV